MKTDRLVYFVRHGQTDWNAEGRLQGQADTGLNDTGRLQATRNGRMLAELVDEPSRFGFVASPLTRTRETMERIRAAMGLEPAGYAMDRRLIEVHFGDWQGHTFSELEAADPGCFARRQRDKWHFVAPGAGAESYHLLAERVAEWLDEVGQPTICVTHGGVLRSIFRLTDTLPPAECGTLEIPQDRVLRLAGDRLDWL